MPVRTVYSEHLRLHNFCLVQANMKIFNSIKSTACKGNLIHEIRTISHKLTAT